MSMKISDRKKNPLLKREEVHAVLEHLGKPTPSRKEILPSLEKALRAKKDLILINKIFSVKGKGESKLKVFVYSKKEDIPKGKLEVIQKRMEKKTKEEEVKEERPAEGRGEEAKPEGGKGEKAEGREKRPEGAKPEGKEEEKPKEGSKEEEKPEEKGEGKR